MIIQLDLDGVGFDLPKKFSRHMASMFPDMGIPITGPDDCEEYHWSEWLPQVTRSMEGDVWRSLSNTPRWWEDLDCLWTPAQIFRLNALILAGHTLYAATGRMPIDANEDVQAQTLRALQAVGLKVTDVMVGIGDKAQCAYTRGAHISIEDYGPHADDLNELQGHTAVLLARPYNKKYHQTHVENGGVVVHSFDEFLALCEGRQEQ